MAEGNGKEKESQAAGTTILPPGTALPQNLDAERAVIGAMLLANDCIPAVSEILNGEEFHGAAHRIIYGAIMALFDRDQVVDTTTLVDHLKAKGQLDEVGGVVAIASLETGVMTTGSVEVNARIVREKFTYRRLIRAAQHILEDSLQEKREVGRQIDVAEKAIFDISQETQSGTYVRIDELMERAIEEIGRLRSRQEDISGRPTHFIDLDRMLNGLQPSDLLILAARPSVGKTAFALNIALNMAAIDRRPVGIFSLEMGAEQLNMRLLCAYSGVPSHRVRSGRINEKEFLHLRDKATEMQQFPVVIDDTPGLTLMQLRSRARRMAALEKIEVLVVDYLQLMSGGGGNRDQNRQQEVAEISRGLKSLARELRVPVIALSQLSRSIEQRSGKKEGARPMLSDLRESGAIEQDADVVMFIHRERKEADPNEDGTPGGPTRPQETEIIIGKHRNGPTGTVELLFWPDQTRFTNLAHGG